MPTPIALDHRTHPIQGGQIFVCALGFEKRCRFVAEKHAKSCPQKLAIAFDERTVLSYTANRDWMEGQGFSFCKPDEHSIEARLRAAIEECTGDDDVVLLVDISSMARPMVAVIVSFLARKQDRPIKVHFLYAPAEFKLPRRQVPPQTYSGPVSPAYAGWTSDPALPLAALIGAGYEYGRALGVLEYLEPTVAWIFNPSGVNIEYDRALQNMNGDLYSLLPSGQIVNYQIGETLDCFEKVEAIVYGLKERSRVLLCPFGPKIFALICLLVAEIHRPNVTVWRVSGGQSEEPHDYAAEGSIFRLPVAFGF